MHILLIHQSFAALDEAGGTRHAEFARYLIQHGHRVTIIAGQVSYLSGAASAGTGWMQRNSPQPGLEILRTYTYPALHKSFVHRLFSFISFMVSSFLVGLSVRQVDLVWGTSPPIFQAVTAWLLARLKRVPFLFEVRDLWPAFAIAVGVLRNPILIRASLWLEGFLYRRADRLVVNSPGFIDHVTHRGARWVELVPNGADTSMFDPQSDGLDFRWKHRLEGYFLALYAGAHGVSNDLTVILEAAERMQAEERVRFVLVGDGKEKANLIAETQARGLQNVCFIPPVPKNEMPAVLAAADACIAILKPLEMYKTTYPNKVFDYMAAGRPVVLAIDGVVRSVVESAHAGIFTPPGNPSALANAVKYLLDNPEQACQMGLTGRQYIERHLDRNLIAEQFALLLKEQRENNG
jgi:glycosyltransferase involved in cell wall biosynthesis